MVASKSLRLLWFTAGLCWDFDSIWVFLNLSESGPCSIDFEEQVLSSVWSPLTWTLNLFHLLLGLCFPSREVLRAATFCWLWKKFVEQTKFFYHSLRTTFWVLLLWDGSELEIIQTWLTPAFKSEVLVDFTFHDGSLLIIRWTLSLPRPSSHD